MNTSERITSQMKKGSLEFCVLKIISRDKVYASDIIATLKGVNLLVVEGTLYPLLSRLKQEGLVEYSWLESESGPPRKYYLLTPKGHETLEIYEDSWNQLKESIDTLLDIAK